MDPHPTIDGGYFFKVIDVKSTIPLRHSVLWPNAPVGQVILPEDDEGIHLGAFVSGAGIEEPVAVISLFSEALPIDNGDQEARDEVQERKNAEKAVRFRKFACNPLFQGQGIGSGLLEYACEVIAKEKLGGSVIWCDARVATVDWYKKRGMAPFGNVFIKSNVKYVRMKRALHRVE